MITKITLSADDRQYWHEYLKEKLGDKYDIDLVNKKLTECSNGWNHAPGKFDQRIERKFFHKPPPKMSHSQKLETINNIEDNPIFSSLTPEEIVFWEKRRKVYVDDFSFNPSSDESLLRQVLFEEIINSRCMRERLQKNSSEEVEEKINNSSKRLIDALKNLGISRSKRSDLLDKQGGDIASLSMSFDKKLNHAKLINEQWAIEEEDYLRQKSLRPPQNILPPLESLSNDQFISDSINLEVVLDKTQVNNEEEPKETKIELPTGNKI